MSYKSNEIKYIDNLLAVRGLSSLGVLLVHCLNYSAYSIKDYAGLCAAGVGGEAWLGKVISVLWPATAWNFVLFFFVHSGYLMGKVFFLKRYSTEKADVVRYYKGRFFRIAPLLYFNLLACVCLYMYSAPYPVQLFADVLFLNNFTVTLINPVSWSLSYEMQYYMAAPFVYRFFGKASLKRLALCLSAIVLFWFAAHFSGGAISQLIKFVWAFLAGFSVNIILRLFPAKRFILCDFFAILFGFIGGNVAFYVLSNSGHDVAAYPILALFAMATIYLIELPDREDKPAEDQFRITPAVVFGRSLTWLGFLSYGIYLWHYPILYTQGGKIEKAIAYMMGKGLITSSGPTPGLAFALLSIPFVLGLTILLSYVTFNFIELRYRPNLYNFERSRLFSKYIKL